MRKTMVVLVATLCSLMLSHAEKTNAAADAVATTLMDKYGDMLSVLTLSADQKARFHRTLDAAVAQMTTIPASVETSPATVAKSHRGEDTSTAYRRTTQRQTEHARQRALEQKLYDDMMSILTHGQQLEWKDYCQKRRNDSAMAPPSAAPAASTQVTQPVNGLLGLSREEISGVLHSRGLEILPPRQSSRKADGRERVAEWGPAAPWRTPKLPAVELRQFPWKQVPTKVGTGKRPREVWLDVRVGFDEHGRARYLCGLGHSTVASAQEFLNAMAPGNPDLETARLFPPLSASYTWVTSKGFWRSLGRGLMVHGSEDHVAVNHDDKISMSYTVRRGKGGYSVWACVQGTERQRFDMPEQVSNVTVMDSETFWQWTLDELTSQVVDGMRSLDEGGHSDFEYIFSKASYEEAFGHLAKVGEKDKIAQDRLGRAFMIALHREEVPIELLQPAASALANKDGKHFLQQMMSALESGVPPVRHRVAALLAYTRDPDAIELLISALRRNPQLSEAVIALKGITGEDVGNDAEKWQQWRDNHKERMEDLKRQSEPLQESPSQPRAP